MTDEIRFVPAGDTKIAYRVCGSGRPLVILSGFSDSLTDWKEEIVQGFAKVFSVIIPDNRGMGGTGAGTIHPFGMTIEQFARDVRAVLIHENISGAYVLGHSMGGMIAQEFALSYPDMVKGLVLYATDCGPASSSRLLRLSLVLIRILCVVAPWHTRGFLGEACAISFWKGTAGRLGDIRCPVLLLKGEADFLMRTQVTREMHAAIPGSRMICIPHGGHRWHDQCPDRFMHMVTEFFQDIPDSTVSDA